MNILLLHGSYFCPRGPLVPFLTHIPRFVPLRVEGALSGLSLSRRVSLDRSYLLRTFQTMPQGLVLLLI